MDPIKPIEGTLKDAEGRSSSLMATVHERYWRQQARALPPVEAGKEANKTGEKQREPVDEQPQGQTAHTYIEFEVNQDTRDIIVRIIDAESGKLVRTIPPDELVKEIIKGNFQPNQLRRRAVWA